MLELFGWGPLLQPEVRNVRCYPLNAWSAGGIQADRCVIRSAKRSFLGWFHVKRHPSYADGTLVCSLCAGGASPPQSSQ